MTIVAVTVVQLLREFAARTSLRGGNPYRAKAYARAADSLAALVVPLDQIIAEGRLTEIPGIGDAIADIVTKLHRTGRIPALKRCSSLRCSPYRACGRTRSSSFTKSWGSSPSQDWSRPREDRLKAVKGLGGALQAKILQNLAILRSGEGRRHMHRAVFSAIWLVNVRGRCRFKVPQNYMKGGGAGLRETGAQEA